MPDQTASCFDVFLACHAAKENAILIHRSNRQDKEFHFQNWFAERLSELALAYDPPLRNTYPDFRLVGKPEGYEVKGLAYPGREASYDSNSQVPTGYHNARTIFYIFGRYPKDVDNDEYPVIDLVICHGDFLNADHGYVHKNKSVRGFGSYGDILIRDRKMYVAPTPFALTEGTTGQVTAILPKELAPDRRVVAVGDLKRKEATKLVVGYRFDLQSNTLTPEYIDNPSAGTIHSFIAYRATGKDSPPVKMREVPARIEEIDED
jgi:hypothetical protein